MTSDAPTVSVPAAMRELRHWRNPRGVLTAYLDTSPERVAGQGYRIAAVNNIRAARHAVPEDDVPAFRAAVTQIESYLADAFTPETPGLALFASGGTLLYVVPLPYPPAEAVSWDANPQLGPMQRAIDEYERVAVVLVDKERARIFTVYLGRIEERRAIDDEVPGKQKTGDWFALAQTRFARHQEEHVREHLEHTVAGVLQLLADRPFDRLFLAGPDEAIAMMRRELPNALRERLTGRLALELFATEEQILRATLEAARGVERGSEAEIVDDILDAASSRYVALGLDPTLEALSDGRTHLLVLSDSFQAAGAECSGCGRLLRADGHCPWGDGSTSSIGDLREPAVRRALAQGAQVEIVEGEASARLQKHGGIAAWTRY